MDLPGGYKLTFDVLVQSIIAEGNSAAGRFPRKPTDDGESPWQGGWWTDLGASASASLEGGFGRFVAFRLIWTLLQVQVKDK